MNFDLLIENISNPALLFFILGVISVYIKSDLEIPSNSSKFITLYLLFSIGFKGGQELSHETLTPQLIWVMLFGVAISILIPIYTFYILRYKFNVFDAGAIAASYGSVSAVTFVTATSYLESNGINLHGYMVAVMAFMESPAIIIGLILISYYNKKSKIEFKKSEVIKHSITNGSVLLILGSLLIGLIANAKQAEGIKPFTNDIFKGFLAIFLLDMGIVSGKRLKSFFTFGWFPIIFAIAIPILNGVIVAFISSLFLDNVSDRFMFAVLAASASYIAVPAAFKINSPQSNPGLFLPMALAVTFPVNITIGMPLYYAIASYATT